MIAFITAEGNFYFKTFVLFLGYVVSEILLQTSFCYNNHTQLKGTLVENDIQGGGRGVQKNKFSTKIS